MLKCGCSTLSSRARRHEERLAKYYCLFKGGPLPSVAPNSERPILDLVVSTAAYRIPKKKRFQSGYAKDVLLPLVQESACQHMRWMTSVVARVGLSISDLGLTESDFGPFSSTLVNTILWNWTEYLPGAYLQHYHRSWALSYLHSTSFSRITEELVKTTDPTLKDSNVQDHWNEFLMSLRSRPVLYDLKLLITHKSEDLSDGLNADIVLEEFCFRAEAIARNPVRYHSSLGKYVVYPRYTLEILRDVRKTRVGISLGDSIHKAQMYDQATAVMLQIVDAFERVRKEGW